MNARSAIGERLSPVAIDYGAVNVRSEIGERLSPNATDDGAVNVPSATFLQAIKDEGDRKRRLNSHVSEKAICP